jgi:tetratricopeptide (TPR) repeat protein
MKPWARRVHRAVRTVLIVASIVSTYRALGWTYRTYSPSGKRIVALARAEALFQEGLDALHVQGDKRKALDAWSQELAISRTLPGSEDEQAGCLTRIGDILLDFGRDAEALEKYEQALDLYQQIRYSEIDQAQCRRMISDLRARADTSKRDQI